MATKAETIQDILDQSARAGEMRARKMFGEYALYCDDKVVGLVCGDQLYIKITEAGQKFLGADYPTGHAYTGARLSFQIDADLLEDREKLVKLIQITAEELPLPKIKKKKNL